MSLTMSIVEYKKKLIEWCFRGIDVASYINMPNKDGDTPLMFTFRMECDVAEMMGWFKLFVEFGGNPIQHNKQGLDSYDIALERFKEENIEEEFSDFVNEVEEIIKRNKK
jgi:hypothetical protein